MNGMFLYRRVERIPLLLLMASVLWIRPPDCLGRNDKPTAGVSPRQDRAYERQDRAYEWRGSFGRGRSVGWKSGSPGESFRAYENLPQDEKERLGRKYREWNSLPPDKKKLLQRRMQRWQTLSPEDKTLYRKRLNQWQSLTPEERGRVREKLNNWETLPQKEKERVRRRFSSPDR